MKRRVLKILHWYHSILCRTTIKLFSIIVFLINVSCLSRVMARTISYTISPATVDTGSLKVSFPIEVVFQFKTESVPKIPLKYYINFERTITDQSSDVQTEARGPSFTVHRPRSILNPLPSDRKRFQRDQETVEVCIFFSVKVYLSML